MKKTDKYLLGILWKFGTLKPGTSQFVFQSYDKLELMKYIQEALAPTKEVKKFTRKAPRTGEEKIYFKLNFTNKEWAGIVRQYLGDNADLEKIIDKEFLRGFLELRGGYDKTHYFQISINKAEKDIIVKKIEQICQVKGCAHENNPNNVLVRYSKEEALKIFKTFVNSNPVHWGKFIERIEKSPD